MRIEADPGRCNFARAHSPIDLTDRTFQPSRYATGSPLAGSSVLSPERRKQARRSLGERDSGPQGGVSPHRRHHSKDDHHTQDQGGLASILKRACGKWRKISVEMQTWHRTAAFVGRCESHPTVRTGENRRRARPSRSCSLRWMRYPWGVDRGVTGLRSPERRRTHRDRRASARPPADRRGVAPGANGAARRVTTSSPIAPASLRTGRFTAGRGANTIEMDNSEVAPGVRHGMRGAAGPPVPPGLLAGGGFPRSKRHD
jgi:hypothetical protein